jgi:integrase
MARNLPEPADRLIRAFAASRRTAWSHGFLYNCVATLNRLHHWLAARQLTLTDAGPVDLAEHLAERLESGLAPVTVIGDHTRIKAFYAWAAEDPGDGMPYVARNPMLRVRAPKGAEPDPANIPEAQEWQYRALLETCMGRRARDGRRRALDRRDAAMIGLLWGCGLRRGEVVGIEYRHVDWDTQMLHLARTKGRGRARSREVWVPDEAMELLTRYVFERGEHDGPLFESIGRRPGSHARGGLAPNSVQLMLKRRSAIANATGRLPEPLHVPSHAFRRGHAADWLESGGSQAALETNNGWKHDGRMAGRYTRQRATKLAAVEARKVAAARGSRRLHSVS